MMRDINANACIVNLAMLRGIIFEAKPWYATCHPAQLNAIQMNCFTDKDQFTNCELNAIVCCSIAFLGDETMSRSEIYFYDERHNLIQRLQNLAIPIYFLERD